MSNLAASMALVNRERPQLSRLLTVPRQAHGGMDDPVFGPRHEQAFDHLVEWVALVTRPVASKSPAEAKPVLQPTSGSEIASIVPTIQGDDAENLAPANERIRFGAHLEKWQPRDPFDPEIFNRQRRAGSPAAELEIPDARQAIP